VVYAVTVTTSGMLDLTLDSAADLGLYVRTACDIPESYCVDDQVGGDSEFLSVPVTAGDVVYVFVDGFTAGEASPHTLTLESRPTECGDYVVEGAEQCDPPDGAACDINCMHVPEECSDGIDNNADNAVDCEDPDCASYAACPLTATCAAASVAQASSAGDTSAGTSLFTGSCTGSGARESIFSFAPSGDGALSLTLHAASDLGVYARSTCNDTTAELGCADQNGAGMDEQLDVPLLGGTPVTLFIDGYTPASSGPFTLDVKLTSITEVGFNDTPAGATPYVSPFLGSINPVADTDYIAITVPGPASTLTAQVDAIGNGSCLVGAFDSTVEIFGTDGATSLAFNDDIDAGNLCSSATATNLAAGTYFVHVADYDASQTLVYRLILTVN
jgi:hypothetical protein